jgi:TonB family protein
LALSDLETPPEASPSGPARGLLIAGLLGTLTLGMVGAGAWAMKHRQAAPALDAISVETDPPGATVKLDGEVKGQSPLPGLQPKPGGQLLRVEKEGFTAEELKVKPGDGEVRLTLKPEPGPAAAAKPGVSAKEPANETERLQQKLQQLQEANAREEARLRQAGKANPGRPAGQAPVAAPAPAQPAPVQPAASPAPPQPAPMPVPAPNRPARVVQQAPAAYPSQALGNPFYTLREPKVRLRILVNENGVPLQIQVADGIGKLGFDEAAMAAARRSTYAPAFQNGKAIGSWVEATFTFKAPR